MNTCSFTFNFKRAIASNWKLCYTCSIHVKLVTIDGNKTVVASLDNVEIRGLSERRRWIHLQLVFYKYTLKSEISKFAVGDESLCNKLIHLKCIWWQIPAIKLQWDKCILRWNCQQQQFNSPAAIIMLTDTNDAIACDHFRPPNNGLEYWSRFK